MNKPTSPDLAEELMAADGREREPAAAVPGAATDAFFERLLADERRFELRVRRLAILSWAATFTCLLAVAAAFFVVRNGGGTMVEVVRAALLFFTVTGLLSLAAAATASLTWLFRSRTPSLRAIDRRLAALERRLQP